VTLSGPRLVRTMGDERHETELGSDGEVLAAYRDLFGIHLDRVPQPAGASTKPNRQAK
jgi:N-hydroxyarylamine O-acetyltransferase